MWRNMGEERAMPKRINRAIELLEQGQPIYYTGGHTGARLTYEAGKEMAKTWADYINIGMEHGAFDMAGLDQFMRGLVDGGPTNSGHRTPAVIVEVPVDGGSEEIIRANAWQFRQILARGVHGILLCHAETPGAVKAFVESCRYPFQTLGVGAGLEVGRRGAAGEGSAAPIWSLSTAEYLEKADPWPLNPDGELFLGLKIENRRALANAEQTTRVPGIAFAEWGPGDMGFSFGYRHAPRNPPPPELAEARARVFAACKAAGIAFLDSINPENAAQQIDDGVRISGGGARGEGAAAGRAHTKREMPV
jgi:4-hydroxy-2-oxoheptanedioate aldolase